MTKSGHSGDTALITGASAGIGKAFAFQFAANGFDLLLVARREERLLAVAAEIELEFDVKVHVMGADLSDPETPDRIYKTVRGLDLRIAALVNNAGFGVPGLLTDLPWQRHRATLEVMTAAPVHLSYLFAPDMAARGKGWIIHVASLSAFLPPHAGGTLYYPVKAFLLKFAEAHREELMNSNVNVTAVCPGFTRTDFQKAAGGTVESVSVPQIFWLGPEDVARSGFDAVMRNKPVCIPGLFNQLTFLFFRVIPDCLARRIFRQ